MRKGADPQTDVIGITRPIDRSPGRNHRVSSSSSTASGTRPGSGFARPPNRRDIGGRCIQAESVEPAARRLVISGFHL